MTTQETHFTLRELIHDHRSFTKPANLSTVTQFSVRNSVNQYHPGLIRAITWQRCTETEYIQSNDDINTFRSNLSIFFFYLLASEATKYYALL